MAVMRQSFVSLGYMFILLPRMKDGAEVLTQRQHQQETARKALEDAVATLKEQLADGVESGALGSAGQQELEEDIAKKERELSQMQTRREAATGKTWEQKQDEREQRAEGQWRMIKVIERYLIIYACFDFFIQMFAQLPLIPPPAPHKGGGLSALEVIGLRKIW